MPLVSSGILFCGLKTSSPQIQLCYNASKVKLYDDSKCLEKIRYLNYSYTTENRANVCVIFLYMNKMMIVFCCVWNQEVIQKLWLQLIKLLGIIC